jgi:hypothetical protein
VNNCGPDSPGRALSETPHVAPGNIGPAVAEESSQEMRLTSDVKVRLHDGVHQATDICRPMRGGNPLQRGVQQLLLDKHRASHVILPILPKCGRADR